MEYNYLLTEEYQVPVLAKVLHSLPHNNFTFHKINNTFQPNNEQYLQSLLLLDTLPIILLITSLLGLLIYLLKQCRHRKYRTKYSIITLKVALSFVTFISCAFFIMGLYGDFILHNGQTKALENVNSINTIIAKVHNKTDILQKTLRNHIRPQLVDLADIFDQPVENQTALSMVFHSLHMTQANITTATSAISEIRRSLKGVNMTDFLEDFDSVETIRWPITLITICLFLLLSFSLLTGLAKHSRCILTCFSVFGLLAVICSWLMSAVYLPPSVAVADLCVNPEEFLISAAPYSLPKNIIMDYIHCLPEQSMAFTQHLKESQISLNKARSSLAMLKKISLELFRPYELQPKLAGISEKLNTSEKLLVELSALLDCKFIKHNFLHTRNAVCKESLLGSFLIFLCSFVAAIFLANMVWITAHTWIYMKQCNDYAQVDATDNQQQILIALKTLTRDSNGYLKPSKTHGQQEKTVEKDMEPRAPMLEQ